MSKVYMDCAWFIFDGFDLDETLRLSDVLECEIWFRETKWFIYDEGYLLLPVFILSDAEEIIKIFCEAVYPRARFVHCKLVSLTVFQEERVGRGVSLERYRQLMGDWYAHNKRIEKGFAFWTHALWTIQAVNSKTLTEAINLSETSEISIHYRIAEHVPRSFDFYFNVSSYHQFDIKLNEIRRILRLEPWRIMRSLRIVEPEHNPKFAEFEALPRLIHETIPAFLDAIKPTLE